MRLTDLTTPPYSPRPASTRAQIFGRIARRHPVAPQRLVSRAIATADGRQDAADHLLTPQSIATAHAARARLWQAEQPEPTPAGPEQEGPAALSAGL